MTRLGILKRCHSAIADIKHLAALNTQITVARQKVLALTPMADSALMVEPAFPAPTLHHLFSELLLCEFLFKHACFIGFWVSGCGRPPLIYGFRYTLHCFVQHQLIQLLGSHAQRLVSFLFCHLLSITLQFLIKLAFLLVSVLCRC